MSQQRKYRKRKRSMTLRPVYTIIHLLVNHHTFIRQCSQEMLDRVATFAKILEKGPKCEDISDHKRLTQDWNTSIKKDVI